VLEIGAGTGANLSHYPPSVETITLTEPEPPMARRLERKVGGSGRAMRIVNARAEDMPFDAGQFDTVVSTLVLCTVADQTRALEEIRRVLAPGGRLLFIEHVRSEQARLAKWQDRLNGLNRIVAHGCNCNRATADTIRAGGFTIEALQRTELPNVPALVRPLLVGTAARV